MPTVVDGSPVKPSAKLLTQQAGLTLAFPVPVIRHLRLGTSLLKQHGTFVCLFIFSANAAEISLDLHQQHVWSRSSSVNRCSTPWVTY